MIITRREAIERGEKTYFTGKPCKYNHTAPRQVSSGSCMHCRKLQTRRWRSLPDKDKYQDPKIAKDIPDINYLNYLFSYEPETGLIFWNKRDEVDFENKGDAARWNKRYSGKVAGSRHYANGYIDIRLPKKMGLFKAHRLAWNLYYGVDASLALDHINNITWDNRISNLREATNQENARNASNGGKWSKFKGVTWVGGCWVAQWCIQDNNFRKSGFICEEDAARYYDVIVRNLYGEFAKLNFDEKTGSITNEIFN